MSLNHLDGLGTGSIHQNSAIPSVDLFGRLPMVTPTTLFTAHPAFTPQLEVMDYVSTGTGLITHDISNTLMTLRVGNAVGRAVRQSREYLLYQPGKIQTINMTGVPQYAGTWDSSVAFRIGLFDDYRDKTSETNQPSMGHYFELSGNTWFVCERANSSDNSTNVTRIPQSNWNLDTLNGNRVTSPSGLLLKTPPNVGLLIIIDRQWLGVGIVRMGVVLNGKPIYVHSFHDRLYTRPYTRLGKLPIRWEIEKVAGGASAIATAASICASASVLGTYLPFGSLFTLPGSAVSTSLTSVSTTQTPIIIIRLQQKYCRATVKLKQVGIYSSGEGFFIVYKNPTITRSSSPAITYTTNPDTHSLIEYKVFSGATGDYVISGGTAIYSGFFSKATNVQGSTTVDDLLTSPAFCSDIAGTPDTLVVAVASGSGNISVNADIQWLEIV